MYLLMFAVILLREYLTYRRDASHHQHDIGFSDTVSNVVEIVKEERGVRRHRQYPHSRFRRGNATY